MKKTIILIALFFHLTVFAQLIDSFSDADFSSSPTWNGDTGSWEIVTNSLASTGATSSNTLHLNHVTSESGTQYLSTQIASMSSSNGHSWSFWIGRRSQAYTTANKVLVWLYANETNLESATVDGYAILIGDDSGNDEIILAQMTDGASVGTIVTSSGALTNGITDIGFMVRVTHSNTGDWNVYTSSLPSSSSTGAIASDVPSTANVTVNQGSGNNSNVTISDNGYFGIVAVHSSGANGRATVEFDQIYFDTDVNSALPVELTSFTSKIIGNAVNLKWNTATEVENYGFDIQRSVISGQRSSDWEKIGFVHGHGNSNSPKEYSFVDNISAPNGKYFYRLKQIDNDGNYDFSGIVEADFGLPNKFELKQNYPNPFNPSTEIGFALAKEGKVTLNVYNVLGVKVATLLNNEYREAGYHTLQFSTQSYQLPSGIYYYKLESSGNVQVRKMILQK